MNYCKLNFDGVNLDDTIADYTTINVENRGLVGQSVNYLEIAGRDGVVSTDHRIPPKDLIVHFLIRSKNSFEFLATLNEMNNYLNKQNPVVVKFGDEEGYRMGIVTEVSNPPFDYFIGQGTFTIHCDDPFRYLTPSSQSGKTITINAGIHNKLVLNKIVATTTQTINLKITNQTTGKIIGLTNLPPGNFEITRERILHNGQNVTNKLDFTISTWKNFKINQGDVISVWGANSMTITYQRCFL